MLIGRAGLVSFANQACGRIGAEYEKIVGNPFRDLFHDATEAQQAQSLIDDVFSTRKPTSSQGLLAIDQGNMFGRMTFRSIRMGDERFLVVLVEDLTLERKQLDLIEERNRELKSEVARRELTEKALLQSEQRLELGLKGADLSLWDWDVTSGHLYCDERLAAILGYAAEEIAPTKTSWEGLVHPDDVPRFTDALRSHMQGHSAMLEVEHRVRSKSGDWKWVLTRGKVVERDGKGIPLRAVGTNLDVTDRKQAEEKIYTLTRMIIQSQERERERIALDLHDVVAQDLSALRLAFETVFDDVPEVNQVVRSRISNLSGRIQESVRALREISYDLRPAGLDRLGLVSAVRQYCTEFSRKNRITVDFSATGIEEPKLHFATEINLFRIIQEALNNVKKHAEARRVAIELRGSESEIFLSVADDGRGFDVHEESVAALSEKRMGLWIIELRVGLLGGRMAIRSSPGSGTEITVEVPYEGGKNERAEDSDRR
jgi:PAS domain S-box-containing protein